MRNRIKRNATLNIKLLKFQQVKFVGGVGKELKQLTKAFEKSKELDVRLLALLIKSK